MHKSPFSLSHEWSFEQAFVENNERVGLSSFRGTEATGLQMIGTIGIIGSVQMKRLLGWKSGKVRQLIEEKKLVQHKLKKNNSSIPVYTIGKRAAELLHIRQHDPGQWTTEEIIQKLITFQFCCALKDKEKVFQVHKATDPYSCQIEINRNRRNVLVLTQNAEVVQEGLQNNDLPIIVIAEKLERVEPLNELLNNATLLLHEDLNRDYRFLRLINGKWVR